MVGERGKNSQSGHLSDKLIVKKVTLYLLRLLCNPLKKDHTSLQHVPLESMDTDVFIIAVINVEVQINSATTLMVIASMGVSVVFTVTFVIKVSSLFLFQNTVL